MHIVQSARLGSGSVSLLHPMQRFSTIIEAVFLCFGSQGRQPKKHLDLWPGVMQMSASSGFLCNDAHECSATVCLLQEASAVKYMCRSAQEVLSCVKLSLSYDQQTHLEAYQQPAQAHLSLSSLMAMTIGTSHHQARPLCFHVSLASRCKHRLCQHAKCHA